ncbi:MAG: ATP phosphoribosyltransferase regulatory subunit [Pseudomonadota bacterium]
MSRADLADALLPAGLYDLLPPEAAHEAIMIERLMAILASDGYQRVKPPLLEFEDSLLAGAGSGLATETFRLMDPVSQRMMGLRADMTVQVARIARSRLGRAPRPLRLSYAGQVLRVKGTQLRTERQFPQVGAELIGADAATADAEIVGLAARALTSIGVSRLSIDLTIAALVPDLLTALQVEADAAIALRSALDRKDAARLAEIDGAAAPILLALLRAAGPADQALAAIETIDLPDKAAALRDRLRHVVDLLRQDMPDLALTIDWVEHRGFEYHTGVGFTAFARGTRGELGGGGRYLADGEPATGFTLYLDSVLRAVPAPAPAPLVYVALADRGAAPALRADGWAAIVGLTEAEDGAAEAQRLGCSHIWQDGVVEPLNKGQKEATKP